MAPIGGVVSSRKGQLGLHPQVKTVCVSLVWKSEGRHCVLPGATEGWRLGRDCVPQREISSQLPARACVTGAEAGSVRAGAQLANLSSTKW